MNKKIGIIGAGNMGFPIARNLLKDGWQVRIYNRTASKLKPLKKLGAIIVHSPEDVCEPGGIVLSIVANDRVLESLTLKNTQFAKRLGKGGTHFSLSTISPDTARRIAKAHKKYGVAYLGSPVFGRPEAAAARKLWFCISGSRVAKKRVKPLIDALGQGVFDFGEDPGAANVVKLAGNFLLMSAIEALGEALALGQKNGIARAKLAGMLTATLFNCPAYYSYGKKLADETYDKVGFALPLGMKDAHLVLASAAKSKVKMPLAKLIEKRFGVLMKRNPEKIDWSALGMLASEEAGLVSGKK
ncbi:MAG TPA: NAD(P)-dependent oxidoreductase [Bacteroidota bacterium]|nr:NAD(P)-dependent oxidoreductase [Bacteroidota bacterium]